MTLARLPRPAMLRQKVLSPSLNRKLSTMSLSMYQASVPAFLRMLTSLGAILDKAEAFATGRKIDPEVLLGWRLAPDMFPFVRRVQIAADFAKGTTARLAGAEVPKYDDNEKTFAELKARIAQTVKFVEGFKPGAIDGSEERRCHAHGGRPGHALQGRGLSRAVRPAQFLFPRHHRLRHLARMWRRARQAGLSRHGLTRSVSDALDRRTASTMMALAPLPARGSASHVSTW